MTCDICIENGYEGEEAEFFKETRPRAQTYHECMEPSQAEIHPQRRQEAQAVACVHGGVQERDRVREL